MVLYTPKDPPVGHIDALGAHNFELCTAHECLQITRTGLPCSHVLAVLMKLVCPAEFSGTSLHPRWRHSSEEWSIANEGCGRLTEKDWDGLVVGSPKICRVS